MMDQILSEILKQTPVSLLVLLAAGGFIWRSGRWRSTPTIRPDS